MLFVCAEKMLFGRKETLMQDETKAKKHGNYTP